MRVRVKGALVAAALLLAGGAMAQEPDAAAPPAPDGTSDRPAKPKPRPKPRPKPKPAPGVETGSEPTSSGRGNGSEPDKPERRAGDSEPKPSATSETPPAAPSQGAFAAPSVACDLGQSVLYDGPKDFAVWVTRTGSVTIDNPLRPLTPDVTRVLQLVIGDKLATAYGRDLAALRRGASPAALEGLLGGPIRWDAALGSLPDTLDIVSDSGTPLAQMRFKECGIAPAAKAPPAPVAKKERNPKTPRKAPAAAVGSPAPGGGAASRPAAPPRQFNLPQGAISE